MSSRGNFIILPEQACFDSRLPPMSRLLYGLIVSLSMKEGFCWASNRFFAERFHVKPETISRAIKALSEAGYIRLEFTGNGNENRRIYTLDNFVIPLDEKINDPCEKSQCTLDEKVKHIIQEEKINIFDTQPAAAPQKKNFKPPTLSEVQTYCTERDNGIDPQTFLDFYEARGWMCGRSKMKDWRASVRLWERRSQDEIKKPEYHFVE